MCMAWMASFLESFCQDRPDPGLRLVKVCVCLGYMSEAFTVPMRPHLAQCFTLHLLKRHVLTGVVAPESRMRLKAPAYIGLPCVFDFE